MVILKIFISLHGVGKLSVHNLRVKTIGSRQKQSYENSIAPLSGIYNYFSTSKHMTVSNSLFMKITGFLLSIILLYIASSCKHVVEYDCTGVTPTYTQNIKPILDVCCARSDCHAGNGESFDLSTYEGASSASTKKSFMGSIQHKPFYEKMPRNADRLTDSQIHLLSCWIANGSPQ
jgi:hypothetical protein